MNHKYSAARYIDDHYDASLTGEQAWDQIEDKSIIMESREEFIEIWDTWGTFTMPFMPLWYSISSADKDEEEESVDPDAIYRIADYRAFKSEIVYRFNVSWLKKLADFTPDARFTIERSEETLTCRFIGTGVSHQLPAYFERDFFEEVSE